MKDVLFAAEEPLLATQRKKGSFTCPSLEVRPTALLHKALTVLMQETKKRDET